MEQRIENNTKCVFSFKDIKEECVSLFEDCIDGVSLTREQVESIENEVCTVIDLETYTELGNKDYEYYNVKFDKFPDSIFVGLSGYHLTPRDKKVDQLEKNKKYKVIKSASLEYWGSTGYCSYTLNIVQIPVDTVLVYLGRYKGIGSDDVDYDTFKIDGTNTSGAFRPNSWGSANLSYFELV